MSDQIVTPDMVRGAVFRALESIQIIENSEKPEIVFRRFTSLLEKLILLESIKSDPAYLTLLKEGKQRYETLYPDRKISQITEDLLEHLHELYCKEFYCIALYNLFGRLFKDFVNAMKNLKNQSAKISRKEKLLKLIPEILHEVNGKCTNAPSFEKVVDALENLRKIVETRENYDGLTLAEE